MASNWAVTHRPYANRIQMKCAGCGNTLGVLERGKECCDCKMWPLCDDCHDNVACGDLHARL